MSDIVDEITRMHRAVGVERTSEGERAAVLLRRRYDAEIDDVWSACTDPERLGRWFLPVTGDLRLGGKYQLKGNAGGEIRRCEPPRLLAVTWELGDYPASAVEVRLTPGDGDTELELTHTAEVDPEFWGTYGPGAVGVGWDLGLLSLGRYLRGEPIEDPEAFEGSPEAREFATASSRAWGEALAASGAPAEHVERAVANTTAFYAPPLPE